MTNITKLPAIIHGEGKDEGKLFTRLRDSDNGAYLYAVQNGDVTMYEVFIARKIGKHGSYSHTYATAKEFGKTAFGAADPAEAEILFEKMSEKHDEYVKTQLANA